MTEEIPRTEKIDVLQVASHLVDSVHKNTQSVNALRKTHTINLIVVWVLVVYAVFSGFLLLALYHNHNNICDHSDKVRENMIHIADFLDREFDGQTTADLSVIIRNDFEDSDC